MAPVTSIRVRVSACLWEEDRILLVEHHKAGRNYWLLPGGGVEVGETLAEAVRREVQEETGYQAEVGRLVIVCEAIEPQGRHLLELVFAARGAGGSLAVGGDARLVDAAWHPVDSLPGLDTRPDIGREVLECWREGFAGPVRVLGNVWRTAPAND
ncbi:MAG: NUDIX domain-containing protein [Chloroflexi bacterium]|nr:MAG: NUDIX domain-containing protein [Chloroflexota bacterium]